MSIYKGRGHGREKVTWIGEAYLGDKRDKRMKAVTALSSHNTQKEL